MDPSAQSCLYREALDAMRDLVLIKGEESRLLWANRAFRDYYGMTEEELRNLIDGPQSDPDDTMQYVQDDRIVFATADHLSIPAEQITDAAGAVASFHTVKSPILEDGQVVRSVGVSRRNADTDISTRQLSHEDAKALARPLRLLTSSFPLAIALVDVGGRVISTSPQWRETLGADAVSLDDHLLRSLPQLAELEPVMAEALDAGESGIRQMALAVDGDTRVLDFRVGPWHYDDGSIGGAMVLAIDVTDDANRQRELEVANERFDLVLAGSSVGIWDRPDIEEDDEYWSDRLFELLGYEPGEIQASASLFFDLVHPDDRPTFNQNQAKRRASGELFDTEFRLRHKSGDYRWYRASGKASVGRAGRRTRMVGSVQDIDDRKKAEQRVRHVNEDLEHFVHVAAHDLREPARRQILLVDLILGQHGDLLEPALRRPLEQIQDQARKMMAMVTGFRSLTGIAGPTLDLETIDLGPLVGGVVGDLVGPDEQVEVSCSIDGEVVGYPVLLEVLFRNLIGNALAHGQRPLQIEIGEASEAGRRIFTVANTSPGGSGGDGRDRLFKPFVRDDAGSDGSGLGLSICRRVVERHRGEIWIAPSHDRFIVRFTLGEQS